MDFFPYCIFYKILHCKLLRSHSRWSNKHQKSFPPFHDFLGYVWESSISVFKTQSNIYDGAFFAKIVDNISILLEISILPARKPLVFLTFSEGIEMESRYLFLQKAPSLMFDWVLNTPIPSSSSSSSADVLFLYPLMFSRGIKRNHGI